MEPFAIRLRIFSSSSQSARKLQMARAIGRAQGVDILLNGAPGVAGLSRSFPVRKAA
jgi:hypothetical protein